MILVVPVILVVLGVFVIAPARSKRAEAWRGTAFAHRGLHGEGVDENTLEAFERAEALAAQGALMDAYRARSATLGQRVQVIAPAGSFTGTALEVTDSGSLIVEDEEGQRREVLAADVSVRGLMGYA